jgi:hypothetical protein
MTRTWTQWSGSGRARGGTARFDSTGGNIFIDPVAANLEEVLEPFRGL